MSSTLDGFERQDPAYAVAFDHAMNITRDLSHVFRQPWWRPGGDSGPLWQESVVVAVNPDLPGPVPCGGLPPHKAGGPVWTGPAIDERIPKWTACHSELDGRTFRVGRPIYGKREERSVA